MASCDTLEKSQPCSNDTASSELLFQKLKSGKKEEIYKLIEEVMEPDSKKETKKDIKKIVKNKSHRLFDGRNIIKKVKTHCLKLFNVTIKKCADFKEKISSTNHRLKIYEKKKIYKIFKSDISKFRNKILLNQKMSSILKRFSYIDIHDKLNIKEEKKHIYNFLMNSTWMDILLYVKRAGVEACSPLFDGYHKLVDVSQKEVNEYMEYIDSASLIYTERVNLDKQYLKIYEPLVSKLTPQNNQNKCSFFQNEVFDFIKKFPCK